MNEISPIIEKKLSNYFKKEIKAKDAKLFNQVLDKIRELS